MKKSLLLAVTLGSSVLIAPVFAAAGGGPKARIFEKYDTNKNGKIDGDEIAAVRKAYTAEPKGEFAAYDKDHDGKLSDEEIAAIKPPGQGGKKGGKKAGDEAKKSDAK